MDRTHPFGRKLTSGRASKEKISELCKLQNSSFWGGETLHGLSCQLLTCFKCYFRNSRPFKCQASALELLKSLTFKYPIYYFWACVSVISTRHREIAKAKSLSLISFRSNLVFPVSIYDSIFCIDSLDRTFSLNIQIAIKWQLNWPQPLQFKQLLILIAYRFLGL